MPSARRRSIVSWILYDWANSAFALTVLTAFFPVFFKKYWCAGQEAAFSTIRLNFGNAGAGLMIALSAPFLGAFADAGRSRKRFLTMFMLLGVSMTGLLAVIQQGNWALALGVFMLATMGFSAANLFYDSLLPAVASPEKYDTVSSTGYAFGYLGCAVLYILNIFMVLKPGFFGFADKTQATKAAFLSVSVWWVLFSVPLLLWVRESGEKVSGGTGRVVKRALVQLRETFGDIRGRPAVWMFLLAYWLYIDGVHTFIRAAADLGLSIGLDENGLIAALLVVQLVAFPAAYLFGLAAQRFGAGRSILCGIAVYAFVALGGPLIVTTVPQYTFFAALQAIPLGALQALSRSYYARLIPPEKAAEYFGFYNLMGKFAVVMGPALVGSVAWAVKSMGASSAMAARTGCASLSVFFIGGAIVFVMAGKAAERTRAS